MKKNIWILFPIISILHSALRLLCFFLIYHKAEIALDISILEDFCSTALKEGYFVGLVALIVTAVLIRESAKTHEGKHYFFVFPLLLFGKAILEIQLTFLCETQVLYLSQDIDKKLGNPVKLGHPSGIFTIFSVVFAITELTFAIIYSFYNEQHVTKS